MNRRDLLIGSALVLTTFTWGAAFTGIKILVQILHPLDLAVLRFLLAGIGFAATLLVLARVRPRDLRLVPRQTLAIVVAAGFGVVGYHACLNLGAGLLTRTQSLDTVAIITSLLVSTTSLFTILLVPFVTHESLGPRRIVGVLVGLAGTMLLLLWGRGVLVDAASLTGMLLVLGAPLSWAAYTVILKRFLAGVPPLASTSYAMLLGTAFLLPLGTPGLWPALGRFNATLWGWAFILGVLAVFAAYLAWGWAVSHWPSTRVSSFVYLVPLFSTLVATTIGNERLTWQIIAGGLLILSGLYAVNSSPRAKRNLDPTTPVGPA